MTRGRGGSGAEGSVNPSALALSRDFVFLPYASPGPFLDVLNKIKHILCGP